MPFERDLRIAGRHPHQVAKHRLFVLDVLFFFAAFDLVKRRLGDVDIAVLKQFRHLPVEKRQKQRADVAAVDVGVGHQADLVITKLCDVKILFADAGAEGRDQSLDLAVAEHLVKTGFFDVQDLTLERQNGLILTVAALFGRAAGRISLNDVDL